jgi:hypothetical protein
VVGISVPLKKSGSATAPLSPVFMHHNRYDRAGNKRKRSNRRDRPGKAKKISDETR